MRIRNFAFSFVFVFLFIFSFFLLNVKSVDAARGCCSWHGGQSYCDTSVGRWVCVDGTYSPSCGCTYIPPAPPKFPEMKANWKYNPNTNGTYQLSVELLDSNPTSYSVVLSKYAGGDPGPLADYYRPNFTFNDVQSGTWYMNVKKVINGRWSTISYWTITVPEWVSPTPTFTPTPTLILPISNTVQSSDNSGGNIIGLLILLAIFIGGVIIAFKILVWFIGYVKNHEWLATVLFWGFILGLIYIFSLFSKNSSSSSIRSAEKYSCNCSKTCTEISSCEEAYYQLDACGCSVRDGDDDGVPCENLCQ